MKKLSDDVLIRTTGGLNLTSSLISSFASLARVLLEIGRSIGSSIRRSKENTYCSL